MAEANRVYSNKAASSSRPDKSNHNNVPNNRESEFGSSSSSSPVVVQQSSGSSSSATAAPNAATSSSVSAKAKSFSNEKRSSTNRNGYNQNFKNSGGAVAKPEIGSVARPGSKKGNAVNDFVQFAYDRRRGGGGGGYDGSAGGNRSGGGGGRFGHHRAENFTRHLPRNRHQSANYGLSYNKEQYLQATCQFVVMEGFNYNAHLSDADLIVDWDRIEELRLLVDEIPSCPICLYPPTAAKMTRCGHIFCWPCILHYLALSDKAWRKCPICYESVYKNQLKSVIPAQVDRLHHGGSLTMRLMRRDKGSNMVSPAADPTPNRNIKPINGKDVQFSKLLSINRVQVIDNIVKREHSELSVKLIDDEHEPESCFIHEALESVQAREKQLREDIAKIEKSPVCGSPPTSHPLSSSPFSRNAEDVVTYTDAFNDEKRSGGSCSVRSAQSAPAGVTANARGSSNCADGSCDVLLAESEATVQGAESLAAATMNDKSYFFYQAHDGQQVYLHPVNARCLIHQCGTLASAPQEITGEIAEIESFVMTEDLRRRFRYLAHLPLTSSFALVELKLPRDIISDETVRHFAGDLAKREEARQRKAKEEKRQQTQAERWERAVMLDPRNYAKYSAGKDVPPEFPISTYVPSAQRDIEAGFVDSTDPTPAAAAASASATVSDPTSPRNQSLADMQASTPSFAQMLRQGKPKPNMPQTQQSAAQSEHQRAIDGDLAELDEEQREFVNVHSFRDSFGDALQAALDNYRSTGATNESAVVEGDTSVAGKRKKKKTKGRLLFATGAAAPGMH